MIDSAASGGGGRNAPVASTREGWLAAGRALLEGALAHSQECRGPLSFPPSEAAGYPKAFKGFRCTDRDRDVTTETFARTLFLAAGVCKADPKFAVHGRPVAEYVRELLVRGGTEWGTGYTFGRPVDPVGPCQSLVEASFVVMSLTLARDVLWAPLSDRDRRAVAAWLGAHARCVPHANNWRWFTVLVNAFLKKEGYSHDATLLNASLAGMLADHVDGGWYHDAGSFDFYAGWIDQTLPLVWAALDGDADPVARDLVYRRNDRFLATYPHVFSRAGRMPRWGRSLTYRFASAAPLALAFLRLDRPALDPGFARRLATGTLNQFLPVPGVIARGIPSLGFYAEDPAVVDPYSCVGSPMFCMQTFLALALSADSPFWTAPDSPGFWADPPARVTFGTTGMAAEHDRASGRTRLIAPPGAHAGDPRYDAPWFETDDPA